MNYQIIQKYSKQFEVISDDDHKSLLGSLEGVKAVEDLCKIYCFARPFLNLLKLVPGLGKYLELLMKILDNLCPNCEEQ